jgi:DNA-directed RNA polymerase subunit K/omega
MVAAKREEAKEKFTKYERARIIGSRALQISMGAPFKIKLTKEELEKINYDPIQIARREFDAGVVPMTVVRPLPKKVEEEEEEENK